uniref:Uncharacterized protein n=1 Tax=Glossina brevipalpis TaxID=37001 RepID=A0A1A9WHY1_9MUSC
MANRSSTKKSSYMSNWDVQRDIPGGISFAQDKSNLDRGNGFDLTSSSESALERRNMFRFSTEAYSREERTALNYNMSDCKGGVNSQISPAINFVKSNSTDKYLLKMCCACMLTGFALSLLIMTAVAIAFYLCPLVANIHEWWGDTDSKEEN